MSLTRRKFFFLRFSLRTNLLLLVACFATFIVADRAYEIVSEHKAEIAEARAELLTLAKAGADRQADLISEARAILRLATVLPEREGTSLTACQVPFRHLVDDRPWLISMSLIHPNGQAVCTSADRLVGPNLSDREYFQKALSTRSFVLSDYVVSRRTQQPAVLAAMPRVANGRVNAVIVASIDLSWLSRLAAETARESAADVILADRTGNIIASHTRGGTWVGTNIANNPDFWKRLAANNGVFESNALDGEDRLISHVRLPDTGAVLAVMRSRSEVLSDANRQAWQSAAKITATGLLCLLAIWLGGERMVLRPLSALTAGAARLGSGDLTARVDADRLSPELRVLAHTFNAMAARLADRERELQDANRRLSELAATDGLTGLANRRRFDEHVEAEWRRACRTASSVALLMVDVDHFKRFNDRYGHLGGDSCLKVIAEVLRGAARRPSDLAARTGGEEFAVLLPSTSLEHASILAEAILQEVRSLKIEHQDGIGGFVTVSIGVAVLKPNAGQSTRILLNAADAALYSAKRAGRNRVAVERTAIALAS